MCFFADLGMPDRETGKPVGRYRECNWKTRGSRTAELVKIGRTSALIKKNAINKKLHSVLTDYW